MRRSVAESAVREVHHKSVVLGLDGNSPLGFTSCVLIDESHVTAHCYSDRGWLAVDVFTCGSNAQMPRDMARDIYDSLLDCAPNLQLHGYAKLPRFSH
jgi:S-adenosylmethionine/arginine decarboxylase-like enzyme